jgi:hypothetical protein
LGDWGRRHLKGGLRWEGIVRLHVDGRLRDVLGLGDVLGLLDILRVGILRDRLSDRDGSLIVCHFSVLLFSELLVISFLHVKFANENYYIAGRA